VWTRLYVPGRHLLQRSWDNSDCCLGLELRTPILEKGGFRGSVMVPFERAFASFATSCRLSIVTFPLSLHVSEILPLLCSSTPLFPTPPRVSPKFLRVPLAVGGWPLGYERRRCCANCPCNWFPRFPTYVVLIHQRHRRTDRQTDRQTTRDLKTARAMHKSASRGKNGTTVYTLRSECQKVLCEGGIRCKFRQLQLRIAAQGRCLDGIGALPRGLLQRSAGCNSW